ncbi:hypothetical protein [Flavobacterium sp.]|uniref:hypothetical protein n=1 Tax=Flavobacterium sp. TaxID=239 RepID=UPI002B4ADF5E|nr:hypothetical protein [Flavobacterium sp.]HLP64780.1 hypothetical protein [Flavobacterium sp.]
MRYLSLLVIVLVLSLTSCRNDFEFEPSTGGLEFSKDTVYLDTVFTNIGSSTYRLKVYNRSDSDISIPQIRLAKGTASKYRIMVDGLTGEDADNSGVGDGKIFNNVELLANDSLFVFIEVTADVASANPTDFLYTDKLEFTNISGAQQDVDLVTLIQDAIFIYPQRTGTNPDDYLYEAINLGLDDANEQIISVGSNLSHTDPVNGDELHWTAAKPYVIYGYALVPGTETLVVDAGARVHFHANSGLIVGQDAKIQINGGNPPGSDYDNLSNEVIFEGDRLEPLYNDVPGQWGTLMILSNSTENTINHLTIKNATVGILMQNIATATGTTIPNLTITNSQIYNCSNVGILARKAQLTGSNLVGNYCGQATLACTYGGIYNFTHCTFSNDWNSSRQVAVLLSDYFETEDTIYVHELTQANFTNCIIYGSNQIEMLLDKTTDSGVAFNYFFDNCLIRFNNINNSFTNNPLYQFASDAVHYSDIFLATNSQINNPKFVDTDINDMRLSEDLNLATETSASNFNDILGVSRATSPDLGAYQFVP